MLDDEALARLARRLLDPDHLDPLEALHREIGDALFELPPDAADRLIVWRAQFAWPMTV